MNILFKDFKIENNKYVYMPLYIFLKNKIEKKELSYKLPPIRKVSKFLNISSNTVAKAYLELEKINYVKSIKGSGFFIKQIFLSKNISSNFNLENDDNFNSIQNLKIDFINSTPNFSFLPVKDIKYAINHILDRDQEMALINEGPLGGIELRKSILHSLDSLKISAQVENIHILSGAQQGIDLISKTLAFPKDNILIENPTYLGALNSFKNQNLTICTIDLENDGLNILKLEQFLLKNKIKFIYLMTNFQTPTGINLSDLKKEKLIELSEKFDFYIIEDDSASDLYYSDYIPLPLKSLDKYDRVIYIKSFSKIFMPGFRLGFIIVPNKLLTSFLNNKILSESNTSTLYQKSFALLLESGLIEKHISLCRKNFKDIQNTIITELRKIPNIHFSIPSGGCSLWIKLPNNISSVSIFNKLLKDGVGIVPGDTYGFDNHIKLNFSRITKSDAILGIQLLKNTIKFFENLEIS
ncbi:PLP-dependent aminotransferase family protein (plasmid) [Cetobacterium somerae]|jgi:DNA-binding transcriptional MocR family regulator|uniref:aminotransferase-like domain-containing protein n=1 Tax=Cetobacterium somerae TaxID=188913 RepID=UPI003D7687D3